MFSYSKSLKLSLANSKGSINTAIKGLKCKSRYSKNSSVSAPGSTTAPRPHPRHGEKLVPFPSVGSRRQHEQQRGHSASYKEPHTSSRLPHERVLSAHTTLPLAAPCPHLTRNTRPQPCPGPASGAQSPQSSRQARENRKAMVCAIKMLPADMEGNTTPST